jgi:tRNA-splicing ligase RtcB (3'-phosphate/5'-hydroxy nucleic acid ligase)
MEKINDKLLNWASILDPQTRLQAEMTSRMPFIWPWLALMPDAHLGKGATVGSVIPTLDAIMPAAVGVDIGCGMIAHRTRFTVEEVRRNESFTPLSYLRLAIESSIPSSAGRYNAAVYHGHTRRRVRDLLDTAGIRQAEEVSPNWSLQLGSLGSGNHFIEVTADEEARIWLFLHSGSRGVGNKLAMKHIKVAKEYTVPGHGQPAKYKLESPDLAYLEEGTPQFDSYMEALQWAQKFALLNREEMMDRLTECFEDWMGGSVQVSEKVNCHHNYTERYLLPDSDDVVWLSRKGAIDASVGQLGLIPGSMGAASYVVEGKGNPDSFYSAPHGAGRIHSRSSAKRTFTLDQLEQEMAGIEWRVDQAFLDEAPGAYKPIDQVMKDAEDLVTIKHELHQIVNVKGM